ncbi:MULTISPECIES: MarR family winged helix-turn-helix transcriptional regulator [unclassified Bacillus (in: firmicutes)]|uniref:MarR family winged helix-turn-helix transcriptional regulator n=1 Tax=unclassified Bacillus (in: firmicutes) TaxID=185979 RepID=UPI0008F45633|nr:MULTISPECIES: MarR family winged helix-turn-helix transcriptional regulator [unclassified Bacillus (in: firmicutes)]SFB11892.1 DNA-binding transcriptional regulator, MarR family [Bacillus sp. UNCCL13]SFQ90394.1 DNA-binding transcriptional regulator, MarR family [Bacillus sp. cl95]
MEKETTEICKDIVDTANALSTLFLEDYKRLAANEFANLSTKQKIILELLRVQNRSINEIAQYFSITASAASQLVSKLEKEGFVKREINPHNRREIIVELGDKGHQYNEMVSENQNYIIEKYYAKLPKKDLETLLELHQKLYEIVVETQKSE